ncbi:MAG: lysophospholipid acyltransferase family protein, partial [Bacteroidia bacterium]
MFFRLTFPIFYGLFWSFSRLPFFVMYFLSDVLYFFLFTLIGYRKKVAYSNLKKAFPQKSEAEIQQTLKAFYRHLCDVIVEFFKMISMDESELRKRMRIVNPEVFDEINAKTEGVLALATHYGNFEWMSCATDMHTKNKGYAIYSPLKNPYFEALA